MVEVGGRWWRRNRITSTNLHAPPPSSLASRSHSRHDFSVPPQLVLSPGATMKRTTHRSSSGKKLYAVRDAKGRFKDIQSYARASRADQKRKSKAEKRK